MTVQEVLDAGDTARHGGHWERARALYDAALDTDDLGAADRARAHHGIGLCAWWLGDPEAALSEATTAHVLYRRAGDLEHAVECAVRLAVIHQTDFDNLPAADSWLARADRLTGAMAGHRRAWVQLVRADQMPNLEEAERFSQKAWLSARGSGDADLLVTALSQLGRIRVARGQTVSGMGLLDEAAGIALAGIEATLNGSDPVPAHEQPDLVEAIRGPGAAVRRPETLVHICRDMLRACEIVTDRPRASRWRAVGDEIVTRYGNPSLAASVRIYHGGVLASTGDWAAAERELSAAIQTAHGHSPRQRALAAWRLARLRVDQGRLDEAQQLLGDRVSRGLAAPEHALAGAALLLAQDGGAVAVELLQGQLPEMRGSIGPALALLVEAQLAADDVVGARGTVRGLASLADGGDDAQLAARSSTAAAHLAWRLGDEQAAVAALQSAFHVWTSIGRRHEAAMARLELAHLTIARDPETALALARAALEAFESMGAAAAEWATDFLVAQGALEVPASGSESVPCGLPEALTPRERRVLRLHEAGLDNADIAQRLYLSPGMAALHLSRIRDKQRRQSGSDAAAPAAARDSPRS